MKTFEESIKRTASEIAVLTLLYDRPMSIKKLVEAINQKSDNCLEVTRGEILFIAAELKDNGILYERKVHEQGSAHVYYEVSPKGEDYFGNVAIAYRDYQHAVAAIIRATNPTDPARQPDGQKKDNIVSFG